MNGEVAEGASALEDEDKTTTDPDGWVKHECRRYAFKARPERTPLEFAISPFR